MSNHVPRVSIGLPVYNGENYLAEAIDSLLAQTYDDFELILSDNASTDQTPDICRAYAAQDARIRYSRTEVNQGSAWNYGHTFALARGRYFKWAAHDDLCSPTFLARCVEVLDRRPDVVWCHSRSAHVDSQGELLRGPENEQISYVWADECQSAGPLSGPTRQSATASRRFAAVLLRGTGSLDLYGLVRTEVMRKTSLHLPYYGADKVFIAELSLLGRFYEIPEVLFFCRVHPEASGNLATAAQQQQFINPRGRRWLRWTRLQLLSAYARAVMRTRLSPAERMRCLLVLARYVFQVGKWKRVLARSLSGRGTGGGYVETLARLNRETTSTSL